MELSQVEIAQESLDRLKREIAELRASRRRLAVAADADRRGIERALHDGTQQHLVALSVKVQIARDLVDMDPDAAKALLDEIGADVQRAIDETAKLAQQIYPPLLASGGLGAALRAAATRTGVRAKINVSGTEDCPPEAAGAVYFCCLEALERAGAGTRATIDVSDTEGALAFEVVMDSVAAGAFDGLCDRVEALGGVLTVRSEPGRGTVSGSLPVSR